LPRKTDASNPAHWLAIAETELQAVRMLADKEFGYDLCHSKLAEVVEKVIAPFPTPAVRITALRRACFKSAASAR